MIELMVKMISSNSHNILVRYMSVPFCTHFEKGGKNGEKEQNQFRLRFSLIIESEVEYDLLVI